MGRTGELLAAAEASRPWGAEHELSKPAAREADAARKLRRDTLQLPSHPAGHL
jgi:hypothetical protein